MIYIKNFENYDDAKINQELSQAVYFNQIDKVKYILDNFNININYQSNLGNTLLHVIAYNLKKPSSSLQYKKEMSYDILKILIDAGADWTIKNDKGYYFMNFIPEYIKEKLIIDYPEKYQYYLIKKESDKYNL